MLLQSERVLEMHSRQSRDLNFKIFFLHCSPWRYFMETMNWANCKRTESSLRENGCRQITIDVWFLRYGVQQTNFFIILVDLFPFYLPNDPENQNFGKLKKKKKIPGDIIILHMCAINDNHQGWFLRFWSFAFWIFDFCPFTQLASQKIKVLKKWKNCLEILSFCKFAP